MSKLAPLMGKGQHIITVCGFNKPCGSVKLQRVRGKGKTRVYKLCLFDGGCNQKRFVAANEAGELVD